MVGTRDENECDTLKGGAAAQAVVFGIENVVEDAARVALQHAAALSLKKLQKILRRPVLSFEEIYGRVQCKMC